MMSDRAVRLVVEFQDSDGNWQPYEGEFTVLEMAGNEIISNRCGHSSFVMWKKDPGEIPGWIAYT